MRRIIAGLAGLVTATALIPALAAHAATTQASAAGAATTAAGAATTAGADNVGAGAATPATGRTTTFCGQKYIQVHVTGNSYYLIKNAPPAQNYTCLEAEAGHAGFTIKSTNQHSNWGYPHVTSGWEWGAYSCLNATTPCFKYPVQERYDGTPETSLSVSMQGTGNASYDIWFNKTGQEPINQDNGTEIMIWLEHPGVTLKHVVRTVTIQGITFVVMFVTATGNGTSWNYLAYVCATPRTSLQNFWLNGVFRDAIAHGELEPTWYMTSIDAGFELTGGGAGSQLSMSLTGVN